MEGHVRWDEAKDQYRWLTRVDGQTLTGHAETRDAAQEKIADAHRPKPTPVVRGPRTAWENPISR